MGAYQLKQDDTELAALLSRAEAGEEIAVERNGTVVAKIIPFRAPDPMEAKPKRREGGKNLLGLTEKDLATLDEPWPEDIQRAFGMID